MNFNIKTKQLNETTILDLVDPGTGEVMYADDEMTKPLQIEVFGRSSKQYRNWVAAASRKALAKKGKQPTQEEVAQNTAEFLTAITKGVKNFDLDGVAIDNEDVMMQMYLDPSLSWIGDQVSEKVGELGAFLQK